MSASKMDRPGGEEEPGGGGVRTGKSWAQLLGSSLPTSLNKNILEVVLEKDQRGGFAVSHEDCARLMRKIGLDQRPGMHVECVHICPSGRGVIWITLKEKVNIEQFCRYDVMMVTESGIRATMIKPAMKKEVVINIKGIHPNTRDSTVLDYLSKFGKIVTTRVAHGTYNDSPLAGLKNGDRSFKVEVKTGENIGSYHYLDGQKISLRYAGQQQTCGRCHEVPRNCTGGGIARKCDAEGGAKVEFSDHILALWKRIGYTPANSDIAVELEPERDEVVNSFTPVKVPTGDQDKYAGVSIRQFPKDTDQGLVMEFLCRSGLPEDKKDTAVFKSNGVVTINDLDNNTSKVLIEAIHGNFEFGRRLYCNGVITLTPQKQAQHDGTLASSDPATSPTRPAATSSQVDANSEDTPAPIELTTSPTVASASNNSSSKSKSTCIHCCSREV